MVQFAESAQCRMAALIQHFGDTADGLRPCGHCDFCSPQSATAQTFRPPTSEEERQLRAILRALDGQSRATGKLHTELSTGSLRGTPAAERKTFDTLLDALTRSGLINLNTDQWTNPEGNLITFKKASLTHEGRTHTGPLPPDLLLKDATNSTTSSARKKSGASSSAKPSKASLKAEREQTTAAYTPSQKALESNLRDWRKSEAAKTGKPAFMVFSDAVLNAIVLAHPTTIPALLNVPGIGPRIADTHGATIIALCRREVHSNHTEAEQKLSSRSKRSEVERPPHFAGAILNSSATSRTAPASKSKESVANLTNPTRKLSAVQQTKQDFKLAAEDLKPLSMSSASGRKRSRDYDQSAYRRLDFEDDLRVFAKAQSQALNQPAATILSEAAIAEILRFRPRTLTELQRLENLRADLPASFFLSLLATCIAEYNPESSSPIKQPNRTPNAVDRVFAREPAKTYARQRSIPPDPADSLTPEQQALDERLRNWRKSESERLGLPLFFVLASTTLRNIVLARPQTLNQLKAVHGLGLEKVEKFGPGIIEVCTT